MRKLWRILKLVGQVAVWLVAVIAVFHWFAPNPVRLKVLVKQDEVQIPSAYRDYLQSVDSNRDSLGKIHDAAKAAAEQDRNAFPSYLLDSELAAIRAFTPSVPIFRLSDPHVTVVKIMNVGWKAADYVKVFFPDSGFVEITKDGTPITPPQNGGWINLGSLEPSSQFLVTMWSTGGRDEVRVISNEGAAKVQQWYVSRDEKRWVIGVDLYDIVPFSLLVLGVLGSIFFAFMEAAQSSSRKAAGTVDGTKAKKEKDTE